MVAGWVMAVPTTTANAPASSAWRAWPGVWMLAFGDKRSPEAGRGDLLQQLQVRSGGFGAFAGVAGQSGADQVRPGLDGGRGVVEGAAIRHDERLGAGPDPGDGRGQAQPVRSRAAGAVDGYDMRSGVGHSQGMPQRRGDEDAVVAVLPEPDDRDLDGGTGVLDIGQPLDPDGPGTADDRRGRELRGGAGVAHRFTGVCLAGNDELGAEGLKARGGQDHVCLVSVVRPGGGGRGSVED